MAAPTHRQAIEWVVRAAVRDPHRVVLLVGRRPAAPAPQRVPLRPIPLLVFGAAPFWRPSGDARQHDGGHLLQQSEPIRGRAQRAAPHPEGVQDGCQALADLVLAEVGVLAHGFLTHRTHAGQTVLIVLFWCRVGGEARAKQVQHRSGERALPAAAIRVGGAGRRVAGRGDVIAPPLPQTVRPCYTRTSTRSKDSHPRCRSVDGLVAAPYPQRGQPIVSCPPPRSPPCVQR